MAVIEANEKTFFLKGESLTLKPQHIIRIQIPMIVVDGQHVLITTSQRQENYS